MGVLFVIDYFRDPNAGTEGQLFKLIRGLDLSKFEPHLLVFEESPWLKETEFPCQYDVLGSRSLRSFRTWFRLYKYGRLMQNKGFKLAHVFFNDPSVVCPPVFFACGIRTIISRRDMGYWYTKKIKFILRLSGLFVSRVVANSNAVKRITMDSEGYSDDAVSVIYNGFDEKASESDRKSEICARLRDLKDEGRLVIGLVANIRPIKRIDDAILALGQLKNSHPNLDLVVIGGGDSSELISYADELGVVNRVHFMGASCDVVPCLSYFDIAVLSSESEGFSNSLVEYMRAGLPVVCSAVGGNPEAVENGVNGFLYPAGDADELRKAVEKLAEDKLLRAKMGAKGREMALHRYSMDAMISAHTALYQNYLS